MEEKRYYVTYNNQTVAENCDMDTALIICKGFFDRYFEEKDMVMAIAEWTQKAICKKEHDGCKNCKHGLNRSEDYPCSVCKGSHSDMWEGQ